MNPSEAVLQIDPALIYCNALHSGTPSHYVYQVKSGRDKLRTKNSFCTEFCC